jgi:hypothetical protein
VTVPFPVGDDWLTVATAVLLLTAVHAQFEPFAVTAMLPMMPAPDPNGLPRFDVSVVILQASGCCVIVKGRPPMVSVPVRLTVVELASAVNVRGPLAVPEAPDVIETQLGPGTVMYPHPPGPPTVTVTDPVPPAASMVVLAELRATVQFAAGWLTVRVWPAIVAVEIRGAVPPFGCIVIVICPVPVPPAEAVRPFVRLVAVHVHDGSDEDALTLICAVPPPAGALTVDGTIPNEQPAGANCAIE